MSKKTQLRHAHLLAFLLLLHQPLRQLHRASTSAAGAEDVVPLAVAAGRRRQQRVGWRGCSAKERGLQHQATWYLGGL